MFPAALLLVSVIIFELISPVDGLKDEQCPSVAVSLKKEQ